MSNEKFSAGTTAKPHGVFRYRCPTCREYFQARNLNRHRMACLRKARGAR